MAMMTDKAFSEFSISKTIDTVVEVGSPRVLKVSRRITSIAMTARQIHMISWK